MGCYSFHETKNFVCGEGGALCINDRSLVERAEILRDKGTNRQQFYRGDVDKYTWVDVGSSYVPSEISSAFLYGQLELMDDLTERRRKIYQFYRWHLEALQAEGFLQIPSLPEEEGSLSNFHLFYLVMPDLDCRDALIASLKSQGVHAVFHYVPLHSSPMGQKFGYREGDLPVTEDISRRLVRLPLFYEITEQQQLRVIEAVRQFCETVVVSRRGRPVHVKSWRAAA